MHRGGRTDLRAAGHGAVGGPAADDRGFGAQVLTAWADPEGAAGPGGPGPGRLHRTSLDQVRRRGWAQSVAEREAGVASASAPVRSPAGEVIAAVSVSGPVDRMGRQPGVRWAQDLVAAARALTPPWNRRPDPFTGPGPTPKKAGRSRARPVPLL
ncbi:MAG: IclR family transcriptional regulator C-terminal domain-containing protein [Nakamurella multipartita]